jgi:GWxTD domain-containing protein
VAELSAEHRSWLEQEVVYLITDQEREVFLSLETLDERERFTEAFWRKRDPVPATPRNELQEEHYARLDHATRAFRSDAFGPGWKTDRGRMFILLGKPRGVETFSSYNELVDSELWFYQGDPTKGLPAFFYLLFFKPRGVGEMRLYSPYHDGPGALLRGPTASEPQAAVDALRNISPELARASLSFDASEPAGRLDAARTLLGTQQMMARIEGLPKLAVRNDYLEGWLRYGKRVSAEYSFNFVPSRSAFAVSRGPGMVAFLNYAIELEFESFPMETDDSETKYYTTIDVTLEVHDGEGRLVMAEDEDTFVELRRSETDRMQGSLFSYQDGAPLVPGEYNIVVILRNRVLHQYSVAETTIRVEPASESRPTLGDLVLGYRVEHANEASQPESAPTYQLGDTRIHPATDGLFAMGDTVHVFTQVVGANPDDKVRSTLETGQEVVQERTTSVEQYAGGIVDETFALSRMVGGNYVVQVQLVSPSGAVLAEKRAPLVVSPRTTVSRPGLIVRRSFDTSVAGRVAMTLGDQLSALGRFDEARARYEEAVAAADARLPAAKWKLAGAYLQEREPERALALLLPLEAEHGDQYEVVLGMGLSYYLQGDLASAAEYLHRALRIRPPPTSLLNTLGDVYLRLQEPEKARELLERSLELDPNQESVKEQLASLVESR